MVSSPELHLARLSEDTVRCTLPQNAHPTILRQEAPGECSPQNMEQKGRRRLQEGPGGAVGTGVSPECVGWRWGTSLGEMRGQKDHGPHEAQARVLCPRPHAQRPHWSH